MRTRHDIVGRACIHVGHRETAENDSPLIRAWLRRCGVIAPAPWCAAFASWCIEEYLPERGGSVSPQPVAIAGALTLGRLFPETLDPQPGDLMFFATSGVHGHCGIVVSVGDTEVLCVEGNSANSVRYVRRLRSEVRFSSTRRRTDPALHTEPGDPWTDAPLVHVSYAGTR